VRKLLKKAKPAYAINQNLVTIGNLYSHQGPSHMAYAPYMTVPGIEMKKLHLNMVVILLLTMAMLSGCMVLPVPVGGNDN
jgi:hypothetical protein